jgi:germination protein M
VVSFLSIITVKVIYVRRTNMRKYIFSILLAGMLILSGCSFPEQNTVGDNESIKGTNDNTSNTTAQTAPADTLQEEAGKQDNAKNLIPLVLYYQDKDGNIVPATRKIVKQEGIARAAVNALIDDALKREEIEYYGLFPVLPRDTEILGLNIKQGTAVIDFNSKLLDYDSKTAERNIVTSVVYTLTEFGTINDVKILVNGETKESLQYGTLVSEPLSRENVMINCEDVNLEQGYNKLDAYFLKSADTGYVYALPVSTVLSEADIDVPAEIISFLCSEEGKGGFFSEIPQGVKLLDSSVKGSVLTLDFNGELRNYGGSTKENGILKQLLYSMKQVEGVDKVKILVEGKEIVMPEGTDISSEIPLPSAINDVMDI